MTFQANNIIQDGRSNSNEARHIANNINTSLNQKKYSIENEGRK